MGTALGSTFEGAQPQVKLSSRLEVEARIIGSALLVTFAASLWLFLR
jgi:hypothetical protein